jgi:7-keto-8-aminopelargonate synthetase-like enzyme
MDGDFADLVKLVELKQRYHAMLCIDEAHATGVFGQRGGGVAELMGLEDQIDVVVGTLSKALGGMGGFVVASREIIDWTINIAGAFIYTTAPPPAGCAAALAALHLVEAEPGRRERLLKHAERLRGELRGRGLDIGNSGSQIVPVMVGPSNEAVRLSKALEDEGLLVWPIRPPTVPKGQARLRISLCSEHTNDDIDRLIEALDRHCNKSRQY